MLRGSVSTSSKKGHLTSIHYENRNLILDDGRRTIDRSMWSHVVIIHRQWSIVNRETKATVAKNAKRINGHDHFAFFEILAGKTGGWVLVDADYISISKVSLTETCPPNWQCGWSLHSATAASRESAEMTV